VSLECCKRKAHKGIKGINFCVPNVNTSTARQRAERGRKRRTNKSDAGSAIIQRLVRKCKYVAARGSKTTDRLGANFNFRENFSGSFDCNCIGREEFVISRVNSVLWYFRLKSRPSRPPSAARQRAARFHKRVENTRPASGLSRLSRAFSSLFLLGNFIFHSRSESRVSRSRLQVGNKVGFLEAARLVCVIDKREAGHYVRSNDINCSGTLSARSRVAFTS
jgi:hypothetical protein